MDPAEASGPNKAICLRFDLHLREASREQPFGQGWGNGANMRWIGPTISVVLRFLQRWRSLALACARMVPPSSTLPLLSSATAMHVPQRVFQGLIQRGYFTSACRCFGTVSGASGLMRACVSRVFEAEEKRRASAGPRASPCVPLQCLDAEVPLWPHSCLRLG